MTEIPKVVSNYFKYKNEHDKAGLLSVLSTDVVIIDRGENKELKHIEEIERWIDKSLTGINLHTEISSTKEEGGVWEVQTIVSGDFKASPAKFIYYIKLDREKICFVDIEFGGSLNK